MKFRKNPFSFSSLWCGGVLQAGKIEEVIQFLAIYLILPAALGPEVYSASNKN
jgi:hypothetical protein